VVALFFFGGRGDRDDLIVAGIHAAGETANRAALACGIPAFEGEDAGAAFPAGGEREFAQARLQLIQALAVFVPGDPLRKIDFL